MGAEWYTIVLLNRAGEPMGHPRVRFTSDPGREAERLVKTHNGLARRDVAGNPHRPVGSFVVRKGKS